jgi:hypothetical protein
MSADGSIPTQSSYERFAAINVNEKLEKKNNFSYLSWPNAMDKLMRADPDAEWEFLEPKTFGAKSVMVYCTVKAFGKAKTAHLPVMDFKNQVIADPNAIDVNKAMWRVFVKACALHGLALYVYAGEDIPTEPPQSGSRISGAAFNRECFEKMNEEEQTYLRDVAMELIALLGAGQDDKAHTIVEEKFSTDIEEKCALWHLLDSKQRRALKEADHRAQLKKKNEDAK